jgi:hypothetical protein
MLCHSWTAPKEKDPPALAMGRTVAKHYIREATALFAGFAQRHGLTYIEERDAPIEVLWRFPVQTKLSHKIALGLQNNDELNLGVCEFWSFLFPFPKVSGDFAQMIDAWVEGRARIVRRQRFLRPLSTSRFEIHDGKEWRVAYRQYGGGWSRPESIIQNGVTRD